MKRSRLQTILGVSIIAGISLFFIACRPAAGGSTSPTIVSPTAGDVMTPQPTPMREMERVEVTIRKASLRPADTNQAELVVDLTVPDACTEARYEVSRDGTRVRVQVWGERPVGVLCAQVLRDEQLVIPLGFAVSGGFVVELNGVELTPGPEETPVSEPGTGALEYGAAYVEQVEVRVGEGGPRRVVLEVQGHLPDACAELAEHPTVSVVGREVTVQLEFQRPRGLMCAQVLRPFTTTIEIGELEPGAYTLVVNDLKTTFEVE